MIDLLSNPEWITPQTDFLLFLQNIRVGCSEIWDKLFLSITTLGEFWLPTLICAITYWCIDSKAGLYLFSLEGFSEMLTHFLKMIACVYRPWIFDSRIQPSELAVPYAKGYSFPSGHTAMSSAILGGCAFLMKHKKIIMLSLISLFCLVGFSRLWLGVHTPQDVLGGLLTSVILIFATKPLIDWAEKNKNRYLYLLGIINIIAVLSLVYVCFFNSYRTDYINGELLVNPQKSIYLTIVVYGFDLGLINGCFACRRFLPFNPKDVSAKRRILRGIIGTVYLLFLIKFVLEYIFMNMINPYLAISLAFLVGLCITLIYPFIFTRIKTKN